MRRWFAIGVVVGCAGLQLACSGGVLDGGAAGSPGGTAGAPGGTTGGGGEGLTGIGGRIVTTGAAGNPFSGCLQPMNTLRVQPSLLIALDTSVAMNDLACAGCDTPLRWATAVDAINAVVGVTQSDYANWGLKLFGDGTSACGTTDGVDVIASLGTGSLIADALAARTASGGLVAPTGRPTRDAVLAATRHLSRLLPAWNSFIVLMTAGAPTCAAGAADPIADDTAATVKAVGEALSEGIGTFVIGLREFDAATNDSLQSIASAGNPGVTGLLPNLFPAITSEEVQSALRTIAWSSGGCLFQLPSPPIDLGGRARLDVTWGDVAVPQDFTHTEGWDYAGNDDSTIRFFGAVCESARGNREQVAVVRFFCIEG